MTDLYYTGYYSKVAHLARVKMVNADTIPSVFAMDSWKGGTCTCREGIDIQ